MSNTAAKKRIAPAKPIETTIHSLPAGVRGGLQLKEAAEYLGLHPMSLRRLVKRGILRPCRITTRLIFPVSQLNRILEE